jgi:D-amino-acid dehydrogenase
MRIAVLGAGVVGVASAYFLARAGHIVTLVDRNPGAGEATSTGNGAIIHVSSVQPWSAPGMPRKILGWIGKDDAPFLLRLSAVPKMWRWGLDYLRHCAPERHAEGARHNLALALESIDAIAEIRAETALSYDQAMHAVLKTYATTDALDASEAAHQPLTQLGLRMRRLDRAAMVAMEPALGPVAEKIAGALHFEQDEIGDCRKFSAALAAHAAQHMGLSLRLGVAVQGITTAGGQVTGLATDQGSIAADAVVLAAGPWSATLARPLGLRLPIWPVKGVSLTFPRELWPDAPRMALLDDGRKFALTPLGDRLRIVGSAEIVSDFDTTPDPVRINAIVQRSGELFPQLPALAKDPRAEPWAGLRPVTPSGRPLIGPTKIRGLWLNTGHGHTGWTQAAGSGRRLARMLASNAEAA